MDDTLKFWLDFEYQGAQRHYPPKERARRVKETLQEVEGAGFAMRYVDTDGQIAWKASPSLLDHLADLQRDAEDELADDR